MTNFPLKSTVNWTIYNFLLSRTSTCADAMTLLAQHKEVTQNIRRQQRLIPHGFFGQVLIQSFFLIHF